MQKCWILTNHFSVMSFLLLITEETIPIQNQFKVYFPVDLKAEINKYLVESGKSSNPQANKEWVENVFRKVRNVHRGPELVSNDVRIRRLGLLTFNQNCSPRKQLILDNLASHLHLKPSQNLNRTQEEKLLIEKILNWQKTLLEDAKPFCDYKQNLECHSETSTCQCKFGKTVTTIIQGQSHTSCNLLVGHNCGSDYVDGIIYYDPFENLKNWSYSKSPPCVINSTCSRKEFFYYQKCWCHPGKICDSSLSMLSNELNMILDRNDIIADNYILNIDQECDKDFQNELLHPALLEMKKTDYRLNKLHTLSDYDVHFCNFKLFLNCSDIRDRCDCWETLTFEKGHCRIRNHYRCSKSFSETNFYPQGPTIDKIGLMLQQNPKDKFFDSPKCIEDAKCRRIREGGTYSFRCICNNHKMAGEYCNESKSIISTLFYHDKIWPFPNDHEHNKVFHQFNHQFNLLEDFMRLHYGERCNSMNFQYSIFLVKFLIDISIPSSNFASNKTWSDFQNALIWTNILANSNVLFCNAFLGLTCLPIDHQCRCMDNFFWNGSSCLLKRNAICIFNQQGISRAVWNFNCVENSHCDLKTHLCECDHGFHGENCHIKENTFKLSNFNQNQMKQDKWDFSFFRSVTENKEHQVKNKHLNQDSFVNVFKPSLKSERISEESATVLGSPSKNKKTFLDLQLADSESDQNTFLDWPTLQKDSKQTTTTERMVPIKILPNPPPCKNYNQTLNKRFSFDLTSDIVSSMTLKFNDSCDPSNDNLSYWRHDKPAVVVDPQDLFWEKQGGIQERCNISNFLACDDVTRTCQCNIIFDLEPGTDGKCYIKTHDLCSIEPNAIGIHTTIMNQAQPPTCNKRTICDKVRFNLYRCRPLLFDEDILQHSSTSFHPSYSQLILIISIGYLIAQSFTAYLLGY